jgi:hypothetical protein
MSVERGRQRERERERRRGLGEQAGRGSKKGIEGSGATAQEGCRETRGRPAGTVGAAGAWTARKGKGLHSPSPPGVPHSAPSPPVPQCPQCPQSPPAQHESEGGRSAVLKGNSPGLALHRHRRSGACCCCWRPGWPTTPPPGSELFTEATVNKNLPLFLCLLIRN